MFFFKPFAVSMKIESQDELKPWVEMKCSSHCPLLPLTESIIFLLKNQQPSFQLVSYAALSMINAEEIPIQSSQDCSKLLFANAVKSGMRLFIWNDLSLGSRELNHLFVLQQPSLLDCCP